MGFRTPGAGPDDFPAMLAALRASAGPTGQSLPTRLLFAVRWKLGALFGWDDPQQTPLSPDIDGIPFTNVYGLGDEFAMELANKTVHTVCHLA